jgi:hypothetical protein
MSLTTVMGRVAMLMNMKTGIAQGNLSAKVPSIRICRTMMCGLRHWESRIHLIDEIWSCSHTHTRILRGREWWEQNLDRETDILVIVRS